MYRGFFSGLALLCVPALLSSLCSCKDEPEPHNPHPREAVERCEEVTASGGAYEAIRDGCKAVFSNKACRTALASGDAARFPAVCVQPYCEVLSGTKPELCTMEYDNFWDHYEKWSELYRAILIWELGPELAPRLYNHPVMEGDAPGDASGARDSS